MVRSNCQFELRIVEEEVVTSKVTQSRLHAFSH